MPDSPGSNYRLVRLHEDDDEVDLAEVYYDANGRPTSWSFRITGGFSVLEIEAALAHQQVALYKSVLAVVTGEDSEWLVDTGVFLQMQPAVDRPVEEPLDECGRQVRT